jgi:dihydrofolate synthase/folylpolyglutamate synthase
MIDKNYIIEGLQDIYNLCDKNGIELTFFELVTMLCFNYFKDNKIDIGVLEVGLGGSLDSTNIINPLLSIITSIGMDHMESLGYTQREIALNKAGIIKYKRPSLIGPDCYPREVFTETANQMNSDLFICERVNNKEFWDFTQENNLIVLKSIEILKKYYPSIFDKIDRSSIEYGLTKSQPCRREDVFEILGKENVSKILNRNLSKVKKIILDVGHNGHGLEKLFNYLRQKYKTNFLRVICGFSSGKDKEELFKIISSNADKIYFVSNQHPRLTTYENLIQELKTFLLNYSYENDLFYDFSSEKNLNGSIPATIIQAIDDSLLNKYSKDDEEIILICGSFFIMSDARKLLGYEEETDPYILNELNVTKFI